MSALAPDAGVLEVVETIEHLDFETPCDRDEAMACGGVAEWAGRASCCGFVRVMCSPCRAAMDKAIADTPRFGPLAHNKGPRACGGIVTSVAWTPYRKAEQ